MRTVKQILPTTPRVWSVTSDTPIADATALMNRQGMESLLVLDGGRLRGMLTTQDCATSSSPQIIPVSAVMRQAGRAVRPEATLAACAQEMAANQIYHLPVMDAEAPVGIVSLNEVTHALVDQLAQQDFLVTQLENYITGRRS